MAYAWKRDPFKAEEQVRRLLYNYPEEFEDELKTLCYQNRTFMNPHAVQEVSVRLGSENFGIQTWRNTNSEVFTCQIIYKGPSLWEKNVPSYTVLARVATNVAYTWKKLKPGEGVLVRLDYDGNTPPRKDDRERFTAAKNIHGAVVDFLESRGWEIKAVHKPSCTVHLMPSAESTCAMCPHVLPCKLTNLHI